MAARSAASPARTPRKVAGAKTAPVSPTVAEGGDQEAEAPAPKPKRQQLAFKPKGYYSDTADPVYEEGRNRASEQIPSLVMVVMRKRKISQSDMARAMGLSPAAVKHRLSGRTEFGASELAGLAQLYDLPIELFYNPRDHLEVLFRS